MCLILTAWQSHPDYPLVVLANRDEFYERPTAPLHWWDEELLAGKDLADTGSDPGTWLGIHRSGKFAALTNVRAPSEKNPTARSRGEIVTQYLKASHHPEQFLADSKMGMGRYNGFNLLMAQLNQQEQSLYWCSNRILMGSQIRPRKSIQPQKLKPGLYGLSNAMLDTPWPKVQHRLAAFAQSLAMDTGSFSKPQRYLQLMQDTQIAPEHQLPATGVSLEWEKALSAAFIKTEHYGTRSTALLRVNRLGHFEFIERHFDAQGKSQEESFFGQLKSFTESAKP